MFIHDDDCSTRAQSDLRAEASASTGRMGEVVQDLEQERAGAAWSTWAFGAMLADSRSRPVRRLHVRRVQAACLIDSSSLSMPSTRMWNARASSILRPARPQPKWLT